MKTVAGFHFPETREECVEWDTAPRQLVVKALHRQVLVVAVPRIEGVWAAYILPVEGKNHQREAREGWRENGVKLQEHIARAVFGYLEDIPYSG